MKGNGLIILLVHSFIGSHSNVKKSINVDFKKATIRLKGLQKGICVRLYFIKGPEWSTVDHAWATNTYITIPLYDALDLDAVK